MARSSPVVPLESAIVARICKRLKAEPGCWHIKKHGSGFGRSGVPDIIGSLHGRTFGLEVKRPRVGTPVSALQRLEMQAMANAGAKVAVVESLEDACEVLGLALIAG